MNVRPIVSGGRNPAGLHKQGPGFLFPRESSNERLRSELRVKPGEVRQPRQTQESLS